MKIISHRAYVDGEDPNVENHPKAIQNLLDLGLHVEIDVWFINGKYLLGHDSPKYQIQKVFLEQEGLWCHAKNKDALQQMINSNIHCFWHQTDNYTLTSKGFIWAYPGFETDGKNTVFLFPERYSKIKFKSYDFICTDYVKKFDKQLITCYISNKWSKNERS